MNFATDLEVFATDQSREQTKGEHGLIEAAKRALKRYGQDGWYDTLIARAEGILRATYRRETRRRTSPMLRESVDAFVADSKKWLDKTKEPTKDTLESSARAIAASLSTNAINAAMEAAGEDDDTPNEELEKVWLSQEDERVRPTHAAAHGQAVPMGERFAVGESRLRRPGDPNGPAGEVINCRCLLAIRPREEAALTAAVDDARDTGVGIFAVAAPDDPINEVSTEDPPHVTTIWLGALGGDFTGDVETIKAELEKVVTGVPPFTLDVGERDVLGDDEADVLMLEAGTLGDLREDLLTHPEIRKAHDAAEQFPQWIPHLTLGYPDNPATSDTVPESITFDALGLWVGDEQFRYPLTGEQPMEDDLPTQEQPEELPPLPEAERLTSYEPVPWHAVFAPEEVYSGDKRKFSAGALRRRPLPQPLKWQKTDEMGHDGSFTVARTDAMVRVGNEVHAVGEFLMTVPETDEVIGGIAEGGIRGVSIDADDGIMEMQTKDGQNIEDMLADLQPGDEIELDLDDIYTVFTSARVSAATICSIPAFKEAWIALGPPPEGFMDGEDLIEESLDERVEEAVVASIPAATIKAAISEKAWDGSASRFTDEEWKRSCILHLADDLTKSNHKLPIKEPNGDLSRAGVHAAASRISQVDAPDSAISAAKSRLRSAYKTLGEDPPENLSAAAFVKTEDGPGWVTHPVDTDRLRDYWVSGPGAAKIGWGSPGDFNRCRANVAEYVKPQHINGYCANRHYDALGFWPRSHKASVADIVAAGTPALHLVASVPVPQKAPLEWFEDPHLTGPSPIVITEEGRVFGHLAEWETCHIGIDNVCRTAPPSNTDYAYFKTGAYLTDSGEIPVGVVTMDTGHAELSARARVAMAHYDNTGTQAAYVNVGEDDHGIWVAGCISPSLTPEEVIKLRAGALSGDWRVFADSLELVAALAVNVPGFPVPRTALAASGGRQTALVAAGVVRQPRTPDEKITVEKIVQATLSALDAREHHNQIAEIATRRAREQMAALAQSRGA